ncbi:MAG TPA: hypothetical protein VFB74_13225 [Kribbellaceae bacterium]|nr:hypothetical protein [Kribbellaceae bacterium]
MRYPDATRLAADRVRACPDADHIDLYAALLLLLHAWQHLLPRSSGRGRAAAGWDLFGADVHHVVETLFPAADAIVVLLDEDRLPDTATVRAATAALAAAVAARLHRAGGDPTADAARRWAWAAAAARLDRAAAQLGGPP